MAPNEELVVNPVPVLTLESLLSMIDSQAEMDQVVAARKRAEFTAWREAYARVDRNDPASIREVQRLALKCIRW